SRQQLESLRHAIELQSVVLPDAKYARTLCARLIRINAGDVFEDRIVGIGDADETILVLERPLLALLVLLELVEREHARAKTQTNQLMSAADSKHRSFGLANKVSELV